MMGFTFRGIHSSTMGVIWKTNKFPPMPAPKIFTEDNPESDGLVDFSSVNSDGRLHYNDRVIEGTITLVQKDLKTLQVQLTKVFRWLFGDYGELKFDFIPDTIWMARIENFDAAAYELGKVGSATIYFHCKPWSTWKYDSTISRIPMDLHIPMSMHIPMNFTGNLYTYDFGADTTITVQNYGDRPVKPKFTIKGTFTYVEVQIAGNSIRYNGGCTASDTVVIECDNFLTSKNNVDDTIHTIGNMVELASGNNSVRIISDGSGQIAFAFQYNFIYGAVMS